MREHRGVALVTGGAVRVGRAIVLALVDAGFDVALSYHQSKERADMVCDEVLSKGGRSERFKADLRDPAAAPALVAAARDHFGPLDVLVSSAASFVFAPLDEITVDSFDAQFALNVRAPLLLARAAAPDLARHGRGRVIHIADLTAERPFDGYLVHSATKAALVNLTLGLAQELAPDIQVNAIVPGAVAPPDEWPQDAVDYVISRTPAGRRGAPEDVGEAVVHFATCSSFVTGAVLHVDGGRHAKA